MVSVHLTSDEFVVKTINETDRESYDIKADVLINAAGLYAHEFHNMMYPNDPIHPYFAKGHYFAYAERNITKSLIYPIPDINTTTLGMHLTLDLDGSIKFGPDAFFQDSCTDYSFRKDTVQHLKETHDNISAYLRHIDKSKLTPAYTGIRYIVDMTRSAKLSPPGSPSSDFRIKEDMGYVDLLGIESPGLTSSLAIADHVEKLIF